MTTTIDRYDFTEVGLSVLPEEHRADFIRHLEGDEVASQNEWSGHGAPQWRAPEGMMPFSPGHALQALVREFDIRGITAVSYRGAYIAHDTTGQPGYFGDFTCTYTMLGIRTRTQALHFLDGGCAYTPVLVETLPEPADLIEAASVEVAPGIVVPL